MEFLSSLRGCQADSALEADPALAASFALDCRRAGAHETSEPWVMSRCCSRCGVVGELNFTKFRFHVNLKLMKRCKRVSPKDRSLLSQRFLTSEERAP